MLDQITYAISFITHNNSAAWAWVVSAPFDKETEVQALDLLKDRNGFQSGFVWLQDKCSFQVRKHKVFLIIEKPRQRNSILHPCIPPVQMPSVNPKSRLICKHFTLTELSFYIEKELGQTRRDHQCGCIPPKQLGAWPVWASQVSTQAQGDCRKECVWSNASPDTAVCWLSFLVYRMGLLLLPAEHHDLEGNSCPPL